MSRKGKQGGWDSIAQKRRNLHTAAPSQFETMCAAAGKTADEALGDPGIVSWIRENYWRRFVPEQLLTTMGLNADKKLDESMRMLGVGRGNRFSGYHQSSLQRDSL